MLASASVQPGCRSRVPGVALRRAFRFGWHQHIMAPWRQSYGREVVGQSSWQRSRLDQPGLRSRTRSNFRVSTLDFRRAGAKRPLVAAAYFKELLRQISCNLTSEDPDPCLRSLFSTAARYDDISADAKTQRRFGMLKILNSSSDHASLSKV